MRIDPCPECGAYYDIASDHKPECSKYPKRLETPLIFRQAPNYIITTGGSGLHLRTEDPARLIDLITGKAST
jgi:hypothetical protein